MRIILISCLLVLASCTNSIGNIPSTKTSTGNQSTSIPAKPALSLKQSSSSIAANGVVPTPTYGTGKTQVEIFADFQCPACISVNETIMPIFEEYAASGKLTITFRQYPLTTIHKNAKGDAIAALCSAEQGAYMDYKHNMYALERIKAGKTVSDEDRISIATTLNMDTAKFSTCLTSRTYEKQVESDMALGDTRGVNGTPTIYLDGIKLDLSIFRDVTGIRSFLEARIK